MFRFARPMLLLVAGLTGCAARGTIHLIQAEQAVSAAKAVEAEERAVYQWTLAEEYMVKAREEWGYADYSASEAMAKKAIKWAQKAEATSATEGETRTMESAPEIVPEDIQAPTEPMRETIEAETIEVPDADDDLEEGTPWDLDEAPYEDLDGDSP